MIRKKRIDGTKTNIRMSPIDYKSRSVRSETKWKKGTEKQSRNSVGKECSE